MTEESTRNNIHAQNHFYLAMQHVHGGRFEAALEPEELGFWQAIPLHHQELLKASSRDWEWDTKQGLQSFNDGRVLAGHTTVLEQAARRWKQYQDLVKSCRNIMQVDELLVLLFPLLFKRFDHLENVRDYFLQEVVSVKRSAADTVEERRRVESSEWEYYGIREEWLDVRWMLKQESPYLQQCAMVWGEYLPVALLADIEDPIPQATATSSKKHDSTQRKEVERIAAYQAVSEDPKTKNLSQEQRLEKAGASLVPPVSLSSMKRALKSLNK